MGDCRIELGAEGWGNARFEVDPARPPATATTSLSLLANEMSCAGGGPPSGRDVRGVIVDDGEDAVAILILVEPIQGAATCPTNPDFPFEIELPSALGDREIVDASSYPFEVRWPR